MLPSKNCVDLIKSFEGYKPAAYLCPANKWTVGYGSTFWFDGTKVKEGDEISIAKAEELLMRDVKRFAKQVEQLVKVPINQNQFDALVSFAYNIGVGNFMSSTLLNYLNVNPNTPLVYDEFGKWIKANGKPLDGLKRRRAAELALYKTTP